MNSKSFRRILSVFIAAVFIAGLFLYSTRAFEKDAAEKYPLLSKRIFAENPNDTIINFIPLRLAVKKYLVQSKLEHSFFFEYLPTGTTIRVHESQQLAGASLLKLPTIISLYKEAEMGKIDLNTKVTIKEEWLDKGFGDLWKKGAGTQITLRQAARLALVNSDNTAIKVIRGSLGDGIASNQTILAQLDIEFPFKLDEEQSQVSARDYSSILKCLYLSCYLNKESSQAILEQLSEAPDFGRIAKGVPDNIKIAHKIGVFGSEVQSDCGIVYAPNRPYILCVILKSSPEAAAEHMRALSGMVYSYVSDNSR